MTKNDKPDFATPPINEVVCGIRFDKLKKLSTAHWGQYWSKIKSEYPLTEDREPLITGKIELAVIPPLRRVCFVSEDSNRLIQVQEECFLYNWRKINESDHYPRFTTIKPLFLEKWEQFKTFAEETIKETIVANRYEITYTNHLYKGEQWINFEDLKDIFPCFSWKSKETSKKFLPTPANVNWNLDFHFSEFRSDLKVRLRSGKDLLNDNEVIVLTLTMGTEVENKALPPLSEWLQNANKVIVNGFVALTSSEYHGKWGIKNDTSEARITNRINNYKQTIAELKGERFIPESIKDVRERYINTKGEKFWNNLLKKEKARIIAEKMAIEQEYS